MKLTSTQTARMRLRLDYKQKLSGGVNPEGDITHSGDSQASPNLSMYFNGDGLVNETVSNAKMGVATDACLNKWVTLTLLIDAFDWSFDVYIDDTYYYTGSFANVAVSIDDYYISGIYKSEVGFDRWAKNTIAYYDDLEVRSMSAAQAIQLEKDMITIPETIETGASIPTTTVLGNAITWTTNAADVTVTGGVVTIAGTSNVAKYEDVTFTASFGGATATYTADVTAVSKYAEYKIGADADLAYGMTSYNITNGNGNLYTQTKDGLNVRNIIVDYGEEKTFYFVSDNSDGSNSYEVTKAVYDAFEPATQKKAYTNRYRNTSTVTNESSHNRYAAIGPDSDKRDALMGVKHIRNDKRLKSRETYGMLYFDVGTTFANTDNALTVEVDVLDIHSDGNLSLRYWPLNGTGIKTVNSNETFTGTDAWKTFTFTLTDADLSNTNGTASDGASTTMGDKKQDLGIEGKALTYLSAIRVYNVAKKDLAQSDYTTVTLADYDVVITADGGVQAKEAITADEAADAKLYVAVYDETGDLRDVAVSDRVTTGTASTILTGVTTKKYNPLEGHTLKIFLWDNNLKPYR